MISRQGREAVANGDESRLERAKHIGRQAISGLLQARARVLNDASSARPHVVRWSEDEWDAVIKGMKALRPVGAMRALWRARQGQGRAGDARNRHDDIGVGIDGPISGQTIWGGQGAHRIVHRKRRARDSGATASRSIDAVGAKRMTEDLRSTRGGKKRPAPQMGRPGSTCGERGRAARSPAAVLQDGNGIFAVAKAGTKSPEIEQIMILQAGRPDGSQEGAQEADNEGMDLD